MTEVVLGVDGLHARIVTSGKETAGAFDVVDGRMRAGQATPLHLHTRYEERLWVLEGSLDIRVGDEHRRLASGDHVTVPRDTPHMITAVEDHRALVISSPAAFADLLARTGAPVDRPEEFDLELFAHVAAELGDRMVDPAGAQAG